MRVVLLIRHAKAGDRDDASGEDHLRTLTRKGRVQARNLAENLAELPVSQVRSSPAVRCVQTVEPLAAALDMSVLVDPELMEGHPIVLPQDEGVFVLCAHGDNIPAALTELGIEWHACRKGSCWLLRFDDDGELEEVAYAETPSE